MKKLLCLVCILALCFGAVSCAKKQPVTDGSTADGEIAKKYEEIVKYSESDKPLDSDASVLGKDFSLNDFTFTSPDNTLAFTLDRNSFVKLMPGGTFYNYIAPGSQVVSYDAGYKTARGLSVFSAAEEFVGKYSIGDNSAVYKNSNEDMYYTLTNGVFTGRLTAVFASADSLYYRMLSSDAVQKYIYKMNSDSDGTYVNPKVITDLFPEYSSVAVLNVTKDEAGAVSEVSVYRFDK